MQNTFVYAVAYCFTHHYTFFGILAFASKQGVPNLFFLMTPTVLIMGLLSIALTAFSMIEGNKLISRYPLLCSMTATQLSILGFVYTLGYFAPTVYLVQHAST